MTKDELITKQQLEIEELKRQAEVHEQAVSAVHRELFCIGGPLNDNKLIYTHEQLRPLLRIASVLGL